MKFLDKYPSKTLPHSKLPKTDSVLLSLIAHIQEDEERTKISNSKTLMTDSSIKAAAKTVCQLLKNIWREHFSSSLIDGPGPESILVSDTAILTKLSELASEWKQLERIERRTDRKELFEKKLKTFQERMSHPFNIIDRSKIIEKEAEKIHLKNQLSQDQPGTIAGVDKKQQKKELRIQKSQESYEGRWSEARENNNETPEVYEDHNELEPEVDDDEDEDNYERSRLRKRKINIMGPISLSADGRGISIRDRTVLADYLRYVVVAAQPEHRPADIIFNELGGSNL